jgi:hypothetical protein
MALRAGEKTAKAHHPDTEASAFVMVNSQLTMMKNS